MLVKPLAGNCSARVVYNLGTAHAWRDKVTTYETFEDFKAAMNKKIKNDTWDGPLIYIATTYSNIFEADSQVAEEQWMRQLGFKEMDVGNDVTVWGINSYDYRGRNQ